MKKFFLPLILVITLMAFVIKFVMDALIEIEEEI